MAWSFTAFRGSANNKAAGAVLSLNPNAQIAAGAVVIAVALADNVVTNGAQTQTHVVTDFKGNAWTKLREHTNAAVAAAGITTSVWISQLKTALATTDSVVLGLSASATAKAIGLYQYAIGAGNTFAVVSSNSSEQDATSAPMVTLNGLASDAYALFGVVAREGDTTGTYTMDADYNDRTKFGTTGGTADTNVSAIVGDRLATLTGDTFAPTGLSAASDVATILIALKEVVPVRLTCTKVTQVNGVVYVQWSDKLVQEFNTLADALAMRDDLYSQGDKLLRLMAIARYLRIDPTGSNPSLIEGHSIAYTDALNEMVGVT